MPKNFAGQNLRGTSFKGQDLTGADFSGADIRSANFRGANLTGANFCRALFGLVLPVLIVKTTEKLIFGICGGLLAVFGGSWFFAIVRFALEVEEITDFEIQITITTTIIGLSILFAGIIIELIRREKFWNSIIVALIMWVGIIIIGLVAVNWLVAVTSSVIVAVAGSGIVIGSIVGIEAVAIAVIATTIWAIAIAEPYAIGSGATVLIFLSVGWYIKRRSFIEDPQFVTVRRFALWFNALGGTNFQQADLTDANFADADLKHARFINATVTRTNWQGAKNLQWARLSGTILGDQAVRELLVRGNAHEAIANIWQPSPTAFVGKNLKGAYLVNADLDGVDFTEADLSGADLQGANLRNANLTKTVMLGANLRGADVTGATLDAWNIDSATNLDGAFAEYVYLKANQQERRPQSGVFGDKEFAKLFQEALNTIDFIYKNGIDWQAFMISFDQLREKIRVESDGADISVQSIENKGDGVFVVRVAAPPGVNMAQAHQTGVELYQAQLALQEAEYQALLQGKDEQLAIYREWLNDKRQGDIRMDTIVKCLTEKAQTTYTQKIETLNGNVIQGSKDFATNAD